MVEGLSGGEVPKVDAQVAEKTFAALHKAIYSGLVRACHDLSEGGLAVAAAEMAFAGGLGAKISLADVPVKPPLVALAGVGQVLTEVRAARWTTSAAGFRGPIARRAIVQRIEHAFPVRSPPRQRRRLRGCPGRHSAREDWRGCRRRQAGDSRRNAACASRFENTERNVAETATMVNIAARIHVGDEPPTPRSQPAWIHGG